MKLSALDPKLIKRINDSTYEDSKDLKDSDGILFLCPVCFLANKGPAGTHSVICWQPQVPQSTHPTPGRWTFSGDSIDNLTLTAGSSSILLKSDCNAHFFIRNGEVILL
jgi:hypothetical protein